MIVPKVEADPSIAEVNVSNDYQSMPSIYHAALSIFGPRSHMRRWRGLLVAEGRIVGVEQEGVRAAETADEGGVGDGAAVRLPQMQVIAWRLHGEGGVVVRHQVEHDLVRDA